MKTRKIIYFALAWLLLVFQLLGYFGSITSKQTLPASNIPFMIGFNLPIILSAVFFLLAYNVKRKMKRKEEENDIDLLLKKE